MMPAYFANMAPVIVKKWFNFLAVPIDRNRRLFGKGIFGRNKTWRGFIFGIIFSVVIAYLQRVLLNFKFFLKLSFFDYSNWFVFGFLMGFGAVIGDLIESFFKRRIRIKPGEPFRPFDQLDFVFGALLFVSFVFRLTFEMVLVIVILSFFGHIFINHLAYYLGIRDTKW